MARERRGRVAAATLEVLAASGGRGLTHRAVDRAANTPPGTAKNYFPTRDALLRGAAERYAEASRVVPRRAPTDRDGLAAMLRELLDHATGPGHTHLLAYLELRIEAARKPKLASLLDNAAAADVAHIAYARRAAGLPDSPSRTKALTLALQSALVHTVAGGDDTLQATGLDDPEQFVADLLETVEGS